MTIQEAITTQKFYLALFSDLDRWIDCCPKKFRKDSKKLSRRFLTELHEKFLQSQKEVLTAMETFEKDKFSLKKFVVYGDVDLETAVKDYISRHKEN